VLCMVTSSYMKKALGFYDDSLDAFGVHAIGGMWGAISTGIFINADTNPNIAAAAPDLYNAIVAGQVSLVWGQAKAVLNAVALSAIGSSIILAIVKGTMGLRPTLEQEEEGLDITQHGEEAYAHSA
jgi:Amt family ammonium transporter